MALLADVVRERAERGEVGRLEEAQGFRVGEALAGEDPVADPPEAVALEGSVRQGGDQTSSGGSSWWLPSQRFTRSFGRPTRSSTRATTVSRSSSMVRGPE